MINTTFPLNVTSKVFFLRYNSKNIILLMKMLISFSRSMVTIYPHIKLLQVVDHCSKTFRRKKSCTKNNSKSLWEKSKFFFLHKTFLLSKQVGEVYKIFLRISEISEAIFEENKTHNTPKLRKYILTAEILGSLQVLRAINNKNKYSKHIIALLTIREWQESYYSWFQRTCLKNVPFLNCRDC